MAAHGQFFCNELTGVLSLRFRGHPSTTPQTALIRELLRMEDSMARINLLKDKMRRKQGGSAASGRGALPLLVLLDHSAGLMRLKWAGTNHASAVKL